MEKISFNTALNFSPAAAKPSDGADKNFLDNFQENYFYQQKFNGQNVNPLYLKSACNIVQNNYIKLGVQNLPDGRQIHMYRLNDGHKIEIIKDSGYPFISTTVNAGSNDEEGYPKGIAHFIEHSMYHGSKNYPGDVDLSIKKISSSSNASTDFRQTRYYMSLADKTPEALKNGLNLHIDMLLNPDFSKITKEKPIVCAEAQRAEKDEASLLFHQTIKNLFSIDSNFKNITAGSVETVNSITLDDMKSFHQKFYAPSNLNTVVIGEFEPDEIIKTIADEFLNASKDKINTNQKQNMQITPPSKMTRCDLISKEDTKGQFDLTFAVPDSSNIEEHVKYEALARLIKKRSDFNDDFVNFYGGYGILSFKKPLKKATIEEQLQLFTKTLEDIYLNPPFENEMKDIKKAMCDDLELSYKDKETTADTISEYLNGSNCPNISFQKQIIQNLTPMDLIDAMKYLDINKSSMTVLYPKGTTQKEVDEVYNAKNNTALPYITSSISTKVDVSNSIRNIKVQATGKSICCADLPDNSEMFLMQSQNDDCTIYKVLNNPSIKKQNMVIADVLNEMSDFGMKDDGYSIVHLFDKENYVQLITVSNPQKLNEAVKKLKHQTNIVFTQEKFKEAKEKVLKDYEYQKESLDSAIMTDLYGEKYCENPDFLKKQLDELTLNDVIEFYNDLMTKSSSKIVVKTNSSLNTDELNNLASELNNPFIKYKKVSSRNGKLYGGDIKKKCYIKQSEAGENVFNKIFHFKLNSNPKDEMVFKLLANIMNNAAYDEIREKQGIAYFSGAVFRQNEDVGEIKLFTEASCKDNSDIKKIYDFYENIKSTINQTITQDKLLIAKNQLKGDLMKLYGDPENAELFIEEAMKPLGIYSLQNNFSLIDEINLNDIRKALNYIHNSTPYYSIEAQSSIINQNKDYFKTLGEIKEV